MESMKISTAHKKFAEYLGKPDALENPQEYLGQNTSTVLNFWLYLDKLDKEQWKIVEERYNAASDAARDAARDAAWYAARDAVRTAAGYSAGLAAGSAAGYSAGLAAALATYELIGSHILLEQGKSLFFVPMFNFTKKKVLNYHSGRCQLLSVPDATRHFFPLEISS